MGLELYFTAFMELSTCRAFGFGAGPIPWSAIRDYATAHELEEDQTQELFFFTMRMDRAYLEYNSSKTASKGAVGGKPV